MGLAARLVLAAAGAAMCIAPLGCKRYSDLNPEPRATGSTGSTVAFSPTDFLDASANVLDPASVARKAAGAGYVLVGEGHPVACDHLAQARVIALMAQAGSPPAIGLEMVGLDFQPVLDRFNQGEIALDDLAAALEWERAWGYPFAVYRPIFEAAKAGKLPVFALNAPQGVARKVGRVGLKGLTPRERQGLPATIIPAPKVQEQDLREVFDLHPSGASEGQRAKAWQRFVTVQSFWDTVMASRAVQARRQTGRPVVIIAGGGHVENGWGIASRLAVLDPDAPRLLVMPWRGGEPPETGQADLFTYCPENLRFRLGFTLELRGSGVVVTEVEPDSKAAVAGFKEGDVIDAAGGTHVARLFDLHHAAVAAMKEDGVLRLRVLRSGTPLELAIPLEPVKAEP